ncbi:UV-damaged DNA-binding protein rad7 [Malassezia sp. CBS 17886]|nr:UV-damaged DNA-binding protein rad7 [Malassezia sp. CBS 17886]
MAPRSRGVRGPTSALTEFLKEKGIRAPASSRYERIVQKEDAVDATPDDSDGPPREPRPRVKPGLSMAFDEEEGDAEDDDDEYIGSSAEASSSGAKRASVSLHESIVPGQSVACGRCEHDFSVNQYTRIDEELGPLCFKCNRAVPKKAQRRMAQGSGVRRGTSGVRPAPRRSRGRAVGNVVETKAIVPSLQTLCINVVAAHIEKMNTLGTLSARNMDTASKVISKNRRLTAQTMQLFLSPAATSLSLYDCSALTSDAFRQIATFAPNVRTLRLHYCGQLDDVAFQALTGLRGLECLELYGPYLVRKENWLACFRTLTTRLRAFRIRETPRFDRECIDALVAQCPNVDVLQLAQIGQLDDGGAQALSALAQLRALDLSQPGVSAPGVPPASLTDAGVVPLLAQRGAALRELDLSRNAALTDRLVDDGLVHCGRLRTLQLRGLEHVTSDAWTRGFARCASQLEHVSVSHCVQLSDDAFIALVNAAPRLRTLNVNSVDSLTPAAFDALAAARPPLASLDVGFVRCITDDILAQLADALPTLETVYIFGCQQVTSFRSDRVTVIGREKAVTLVV